MTNEITLYQRGSIQSTSPWVTFFRLALEDPEALAKVSLVLLGTAVAAAFVRELFK